MLNLTLDQQEVGSAEDWQISYLYYSLLRLKAWVSTPLLVKDDSCKQLILLP